MHAALVRRISICHFERIQGFKIQRLLSPGETRAGTGLSTETQGRLAAGGRAHSAPWWARRALPASGPGRGSGA